MNNGATARYSLSFSMDSIRLPIVALVFLAASVVAFGGGITPVDSVAVLGAPLGGDAWLTDVQTKLVESGQFNQVDVVRVDLVTPTPADLLAYNAVLVFGDGIPYANPVALGDNLAGYVDAGGGVVLATFGNVNLPWALAGRWATETSFDGANPGYWVIRPGAQSSPAALTLGFVAMPGSPLVSGITAFSGGSASYHSAGSLHPASTTVASWSNGRPLIATRSIGIATRVDLNFFPPSSAVRSDFWDETTDGGALMMANALTFVAPGDTDGDGLTIGDNCPAVSNPATDCDMDPETPDIQCDSDLDGVGDACDNCPDAPNPVGASGSQADGDDDGVGDACDNCLDVDDDGFGDPDLPAVGECEANPALSCSPPPGGGAVGNCPPSRCFDQMTACTTATQAVDCAAFAIKSCIIRYCTEVTCPSDNCVDIDNPGQEDMDMDQVGDVCDMCPGDTGNDADGDTICSLDDNCPTLANQNQADSDDDGIGDVCDACPNDPDNDADNDNICGNVDNCPTIGSQNQADGDGDGVGDPCDNCPGQVNPLQLDTDFDNYGNSCDNCPGDVNFGQQDQDLDGRGDACDACPTEFDLPGSDEDMDGIGDSCDNCFDTANSDQADADEDGIGDACDTADGLIAVYFEEPAAVSWQLEEGFPMFNAYRGDLDVLRSTGVYTQSPGSNVAADQACGLPQNATTAGSTPDVGKVVFFLVSGTGAEGETDLGTDSAGNPRPNVNPCN